LLGKLPGKSDFRNILHVHSLLVMPDIYGELSESLTTEISLIH